MPRLLRTVRRWVRRVYRRIKGNGPASEELPCEPMDPKQERELFDILFSTIPDVPGQRLYYVWLPGIPDSLL